jgi:hypothetical protein
MNNQFGTYLRWKILRRLKSLQKKMGRAVSIPLTCPADDSGLNAQLERVMRKYGVTENRAIELRSKCFSGATRNRYSAYSLSRAVALPSSLEIDSSESDLFENPVESIPAQAAHAVIFLGMTELQKKVLSSVIGISCEPRPVSWIAKKRGVARQSVHQAYQRALEIAKLNISARARELSISPMDFA